MPSIQTWILYIRRLMTKTAILGGSFDPVHLGHLFLLHSAIEKTDYTRFVIVPAKVSNFKRDSRPVSTDADRLNMLNLAVEDFHTIYPDNKKEIVVSNIELVRGGVSYTYDTVLEVKKQYNVDEKLGLIIGDDHIEKLTQWYRFNDLVKEVEFIICPRNHREFLDEIPYGIDFRILDVEETKVENSTEIRSDINRYSKYLSPRVLSYARERNLYS